MRTAHRVRLRAALLAIATAAAAMLGFTVSPAQADVDSVSGSAAPLLINGQPALGSPVSGSATEPQDGYGPFNTSLLGNPLVPLPTSVLLSIGLLNASTEGGNVAGENHFGFATSSSSVANVVLGGTQLGVVSSTCIADGEGARGSSVIAGIPNLPAPTPGGTPVQLPITPTVPGLPNVLTVFVNDVTVVNQPGTATITVNALRVNLLGIDIILAQSVCRAFGPNVNVTTTTTAAPTTTTTGGQTTTTVGHTTTTTAPVHTTTTLAGGGGGGGTGTGGAGIGTGGIGTGGAGTGTGGVGTGGDATAGGGTATGGNASVGNTTAQGPTIIIDGVTITGVTPGTVAGGQGSQQQQQQQQQLQAQSLRTGVLARTGNDVRPMVLLAMVAVMIGIILRYGSGNALRPAMADAGPAPAVFRPVRTRLAEMASTVRGPLDPAAAEALAEIDAAARYGAPVEAPSAANRARRFLRDRKRPW